VLAAEATMRQGETRLPPYESSSEDERGERTWGKPVRQR
jgi:hypothetical protein